MNAIGFTEMITSNQSVVLKDQAATEQNLVNLFHCPKGTMFGDPYFGTNIQKFFYDNNNVVLQDLIIDDMYSAIAEFIPQLRVLREDIKLTGTLNTVSATIRAQNLLDFNFETYNIKLLDVEELQ